MRGSIKELGETMDQKISKIAEEMSAIVGEEFVSTSIFERVKNALDPFPYDVTRDKIPYCVVLPKNKEEISEILKFANKFKIPVFVRGSGTILTGASRPHKPGIIINTRRLNQFWIYEDYGFFEAEAGVRCGDIASVLSEHGYFLPMWPGSRVIASIGGLASNNTSGHVIDACIGKSADYILGLEVVLPTGEILETGTKGLRKPAGTDLTKFFVGGDGLFGIITKIRMRLVPAKKTAYGIAVFDDLENLAKGVQRMYWEKRPPPLFMEFMAQDVAEIGFKVKGMDPPNGHIIFFVGIGDDELEAQRKMEKVMEGFNKENPIEARPITDLDEWLKLWSAREVIASYLMSETGGRLIAAEVVSNLAQLVDCVKDAERFNQGLPILSELHNYLFGHIGALTMHPTFLIPPDWPEDKRIQAVDELFKKEAELNLKYQTCGGEWGQFAKRTNFFIQRYGNTAYDLVKRLKSVFDPNNILNPGILEGMR